MEKIGDGRVGRPKMALKKMDIICGSVPSIERVPRVPGHPSKLSNGCQAPVLWRAFSYENCYFRKKHEIRQKFWHFNDLGTRLVKPLTRSLWMTPKEEIAWNRPYENKRLPKTELHTLCFIRNAWKL